MTGFHHKFFFLSLSFFVTNGLNAILPGQLPYDPWYKGPDYNDFADAGKYMQNANALSAKITGDGNPLWVEPSDTINYVDYRCVGAHNAHVYERWFNTVYQHRHSTTHMLYYGVRGLMWDTYKGDSFTKQGPPDATVILSHGSPGPIAFTQKGNTTYQTLQYELKRVTEFLKSAPKAVVTIILEDYADPIQTAAEIKKQMTPGTLTPLFTMADYNSTNGKPAGWPTLGWMRKNNKRLVIFTQRADSTDVTFSQFTYCRENQYSTTDINKLCNERTESAAKKGTPTQQIVIFNNFSDLAVTQSTSVIKSSVEYNNVLAIVKKCAGAGWPKIFNQYYADRIIDCCNELMEAGQKTVFHYVNEVNKITALRISAGASPEP